MANPLIQIDNIVITENLFQLNYLRRKEFFLKNTLNGFQNGMDSTFIVKKFMIVLLVQVKI